MLLHYYEVSASDNLMHIILSAIDIGQYVKLVGSAGRCLLICDGTSHQVSRL